MPLGQIPPPWLNKKEIDKLKVDGQAKSYTKSLGIRKHGAVFLMFEKAALGVKFPNSEICSPTSAFAQCL
jgi:hypothetical protein